MISRCTSSGEAVPVKFTTFSDGSETVVLGNNNSLYEGPVTLSCDVEDCNRDIIRILLVKDALDRYGITSISLYIPYVPQARADRVFGDGMPLPIKLFCDMINTCNFEQVFIQDPHSDVTSALINNVTVMPQHLGLRDTLRNIRSSMPEFTLCAPDLGATKKIFDSVQMLKHEDYIQAIKIRDVLTGNIIKCDVIGEVVSGDILIVDDISDKGGSFIHLARKLKEMGASRVGLYITHAIFPDGLKTLEKDVDFIWAKNIIGNTINQETLLRFNER